MPENTLLSQKTPLKKRVAIRTMESDIAELFKTKKPSVGELVAPPPLFQEKNAPKKFFGVKVIIFFIVALLLGAGAYFLLVTIPAPPPPAAPAPGTTPPTPFFATENSKTVVADLNEPLQFYRLMDKARQEAARNGTITRVILKLTTPTGERFASLKDFFTLYRITPPITFLEWIEPYAMFFFHYKETGGHFGLVAKTRDPERTFRDMLEWESALFSSFQPLFSLGEENLTAPFKAAMFEDRTYRNIDWRFSGAGTGEAGGIGYTIFPAGNYLVITTSTETMERIIDRLFDAR